MEQEHFSTKIYRVIGHNYGEPEFNVMELSHSLGLDRTTLFRKCKKYLKKTPHKILDHYRMTKAYEMLSAEDIRVCEVAYSIGYTDPRYFSKKFKTHFGCTPKTILAN